MSCPSRGTWIEIAAVALLAAFVAGRAPRGARGLKYGHNQDGSHDTYVVPLAGHVD